MTVIIQFNSNMKKALLLSVGVFTTLLTNAQDLIIPKRGEPVKAYNTEVGSNFVFYMTEQKEDAPILRIPKDSVLIIRRADGSTLPLSGENTNFNTLTNEITSSNDFPIIEESDIHGSFIAKGNRVYIPTNSIMSYERVGQERLKEIISQWGYWTVVDTPKQAHFVLHFITTTSWKDKSWLFVRPRKYYEAYPSPSSYYNDNRVSFMEAKNSMGIFIGKRLSNENNDTNITNAEELANYLIRVITNPEEKESKKFHKYLDIYLDADSQMNNYIGW